MTGKRDNDGILRTLLTNFIVRCKIEIIKIFEQHATQIQYLVSGLYITWYVDRYLDVSIFGPLCQSWLLFSSKIPTRSRFHKLTTTSKRFFFSLSYPLKYAGISSLWTKMLNSVISLCLSVITICFMLGYYVFSLGKSKEKSLRKKKRKKAGFKTNEKGLKRTKEGEVKKDLLGG